MRMPSSPLVRGLLIFGGVGLALGAPVAIEAIREWGWAAALTPPVAAFGCVGLLGAIFAFDSASPVAVGTWPFVRIAMSALAGAGFGAALLDGAAQVMLSALVAGLLGALGMRWAKYVAF
jgi:hypothetical protein